MFASVYARLQFKESDGEFFAQFHSRMDNRHIVFVGDSVMRYQYISLAYWLHTGAFPAHKPTMLYKNNFAELHTIYSVTNAMLYPAEYCDCSVFGEKLIVENRFYYNEKRNISFSFYFYAGDYRKIYGFWLAGGPNSNHKFYPPPHNTNRSEMWAAYTIHDLLTAVAPKLNPKPTVLLLNAGQWRNKYSHRAYRTSVFRVALANFDRVIWKTTNYCSDHLYADTANDEACKLPRVECMNMSWTQHLSDRDYMDTKHHTPEIYEDMNVQFLYQLVHNKPHPALA